MNRLFSNSKLSTFSACPRKAYFTYVEKLETQGMKPAADFGSAWHRAMDVVWSMGNHEFGTVFDMALAAFNAEWAGLGHPAIPAKDDPDANQYFKRGRTPQNAGEMLSNYIELRAETIQRWELIGYEQPFVVPLDPEDEGLLYCGLFDKLVRLPDGRVYFIEHKTTSSVGGSAKTSYNLKQSYTDSFSPNSQIDGYLYAGQMLYGEEFGGGYVDVAGVSKYTSEVFTLIPIARDMNHTESWLWETLEKARLYEEYESATAQHRNSTILPAFPKNTDRCNDWNSPCQFLDFCKDYINPARELQEIYSDGIPDGFKRKTDTIFSNIKLEKLGMKEEETIE